MGSGLVPSQSDDASPNCWNGILRIVKADLNRKNGTITDLSGPEALDRFRKAVKAFDKRVNRSPETARQMLISEGIYTKSGKLSKNYR